MIWKDCILFSSKKIGEDELQNPIVKDVPETTVKGRFTEWSNEEIASLDREVTSSQRRLLLKLLRSEALNVSKVEIEGEKYDVVSMTDLFPRYVLLYVRADRV